MTSKLTLVSVNDRVSAANPAAFHEMAAAKYIGTNRTQFRQLMFAGIIPFTTHMNGRSRLYLRADLDAYLESLPKSRMPIRENQLVALKGAS